MRLLLLPGFACVSSIWEPVCHAADSVECRAVDWPRDLTPGWDEPACFSRWLMEQGLDRDVDVVVGHSMGGLVALDLASRRSLRGVVLVESFITTPPPGFRTLVHPGTPAEARAEIQAMLSAGAVHYSAAFKEGLRTGAFTPGAWWPENTPVLVVYGQREESIDPSVVARDLGFDGTQRGPVSFALVPRAGHFPMLENPTGLAAVVQRWLEHFGA
jgi:pimeloyl-ACP methyl ester carboxylesterase